MLHQELICRLHSAIKLLEQSERELILAIYFEGLTERQLARRADLHHMTIHSRKIRILQKLKNLLKK